MKKLLANISIEVDTHENGTYDAYIATENSSGEKYSGITAESIGEKVADLIDCLEEANSQNSYLTTHYMLIFTDGYTIKTQICPSKDDAYDKMKQDYYNYLDTGSNKDDSRNYLDKNNAILYTGYDVYVWKICPITNK